MVLVNGAEGIGTGWSTSVPSYNPRDVVENIKRMLRGEEMIAMAPWYRNFKVELLFVVFMKKQSLISLLSFDREQYSWHPHEVPIRASK